MAGDGRACVVDITSTSHSDDRDRRWGPSPCISYAFSVRPPFGLEGYSFLVSGDQLQWILCLEQRIAFRYHTLCLPPRGRTTPNGECRDPEDGGECSLGSEVVEWPGHWKMGLEELLTRGSEIVDELDDFRTRIK